MPAPGSGFGDRPPLPGGARGSMGEEAMPRPIRYNRCRKQNGDARFAGWRDRGPVVGPHRSVVTSNGIFRAVCLVDGRVVGTWTLPSGTVDIHLLEGVGGRALVALEQDAADVLRFLGRAPAPVRATGT